MPDPCQQVRRRCLCQVLSLPLLAACPTVLLPGIAHAALEDDKPPPSLQGWQRWGQGDYRRFGLLIYRASLWGKRPSAAAGTLPTPPYALVLDYQRNLSRRVLVEASLSEMQRRPGLAAEQLARWGEQLTAIFPEVRAGERITGLHLPGLARFYLQRGNGSETLLGEIADPGFASAFFAIWLAESSSAPTLRRALLGLDRPD